MKILTLGAGKLLQPLVPLWQARGYDVTQVRRSKPASEGLLTIEWDVTKESNVSLPNVDKAVVVLSPSERTEQAYEALFEKGVQRISQKLKELSTLRQVIFVSSTAVYPSESSFPFIEMDATASNFRGRAILQAEQHLASGDWDTVSLRCGGIYGPTRAGRLLKNLAKPIPDPFSNAGVHRIHEEDVQGLIDHFIQNKADISGPITCVDGNPASQYQLAQQLTEKPVRSNEKEPQVKRLFDLTRLGETGYQLRWPDAVQAYQAMLNQ